MQEEGKCNIKGYYGIFEVNFLTAHMAKEWTQGSSSIPPCHCPWAHSKEEHPCIRKITNLSSFSAKSFHPEHHRCFLCKKLQNHCCASLFGTWRGLCVRLFTLIFLLPFCCCFCTLFALFVFNLCCPELPICHLCSAFMHFILPAEMTLNASAARMI